MEVVKSIAPARQEEVERVLGNAAKVLHDAVCIGYSDDGSLQAFCTDLEKRDVIYMLEWLKLEVLRQGEE